MKQSSSIEWLKHSLEQYGDPQMCMISWEDLDSLFEQSKEIHKKEIVEAAERWKGTIFAEQYYKETFEEENEEKNT